MRIIQLICIVILFQSCTAQEAKINGVSFVAHRDSITQKNVNPLLNVNANYAAIMPFGVIKDLAHPEVSYGAERQWFGETKVGGKQYVKALKKDNIKIMLKPQLWVWRGEFTGFITMKTEADWQTLEETYSKYILEFGLKNQFCVRHHISNSIVLNRLNSICMNIKNIFFTKSYWITINKDENSTFK